MSSVAHEFEGRLPSGTRVHIEVLRDGAARIATSASAPGMVFDSLDELIGVLRVSELRPGPPRSER